MARGRRLKGPDVAWMSWLVLSLVTLGGLVWLNLDHGNAPDANIGAGALQMLMRLLGLPWSMLPVESSVGIGPQVSVPLLDLVTPFLNVLVLLAVAIVWRRRARRPSKEPGLTRS